VALKYVVAFAEFTKKNKLVAFSAELRKSGRTSADLK
jgi:hypothetical protein